MVKGTNTEKIKNGKGTNTEKIKNGKGNRFRENKER